ncbi:TIGR03751 family conjugal transfer lipoprotein [Pseudomonas fluorescens]|jgi:conjugative transfer region lipoprotein (TIGR03751 family)|uniref:TIGR03751 family conjugal transfer lipoprotein n=1 Tax=Pseudomonas TaxID=286 RepID=UPI00084B3ED9|nr:TIGR03751 family conjugal transfer lipoprotein [Pseudomonas sp. AP19]NKI45812.1 TIGR03751 family conjugal transfer lipoprotein [Pseudomonas fluorescens]NKI55665.1 TIGR03751 family conjugal transfer lipoprotein [Pseudomonas fluorescens]NKI62464.1 TIGR03751 family conjugal transfer lipoprotein [Pseudomonas fluorescens]OEC72971.1 conjugal transfer protein [Pseudomonas sp. AP19]
MKKTMLPYLTLISVFSLVLAGCSTNKETLLPHGEQTMLDIWNGAGSQGTQQQLLDARQQLRRPLAQADVSVALQEPYTRTAANEIHNLFPRLPNPDLVLYVYPHLSGTEQAPVPGYSTVFPFYQRVQYALPGERQEDL